MLANHTYTGSNNKQNSMFPLEYMYLTQGEGGSYSHAGTYAMDFQGYDSNGRVYNCPYYAPVDLTLVAISDSASHGYVYTSNQQVNFIDGTSDYLTILVAHDSTSYSVGRTVSQGQLLGHTGTYGVATGDHVHIEVKKGTYEGCHYNSYNIYMLTNSTHIYDLLGKDDTVIVEDGDYNWRDYGTSPTPITIKKKFPWVLYARKLRDRYK